MNFVVTVIVGSMLAAAVVTFPVLFASVLDGWSGIAAGFGAAWVSGLLLAALAYIRFADEVTTIKKIITGLIFI